MIIFRFFFFSTDSAKRENTNSINVNWIKIKKNQVKTQFGRLEKSNSLSTLF